MLENEDMKMIKEIKNKILSLLLLPLVYRHYINLTAQTIVSTMLISAENETIEYNFT